MHEKTVLICVLGMAEGR